MASPATADDIKALRFELKDSFEDVTALLRVFMQQVDSRFTAIEQEQQKTHQEISRVFDYLDNLLKKHEITDDERLVMGHQLDRLDQWTHELAKKIGYELSS